MEDEFLLFVIASFVEKFFIFFLGYLGTILLLFFLSSSLFILDFFPLLLFVENGRREIRDLISYHFVFFSLSS